MKKFAAALLIACSSLLAIALQAQEGASGLRDELKSAEILSDNRVVFRIYAPSAAKVNLSGDWVTQGRGKAGPMQKDADGVWALTVGPLAPDFYGYSFAVDGVPTLDPKNVQIKVGVSSVQNILEIPGPAEEFEAAKAVPHGEVREAWYQSSTFGELRRVHIYTPPDYNTSREKYPVLYLINGGGDEDSAWTSLGRANFILDNLIAAKKAKPMIIVMPNGNTSLPGIVTAMMADRVTPEGIKLRVATLAKLHDAFVQDLLTDVLPYVEKNYRVLATPDKRAVAGLSMGGAETLRTGVGHFGMFGYIGVFSMGAQPGMNGPFTEEFETRNAAFFKNPDLTNKTIKLFWIGVGSDDKTVGRGPKNLADGLARHGIRYEYHETEGGHTWMNWRPYLFDFSQKLFQ
jgi:enterochelin esterase-like enzyme